MPLHSLDPVFASVDDQGGPKPRLQGGPQPASQRDKAFDKAYRRVRHLTDAQIVEAACAPQADELRGFAKAVIKLFLSEAF